MADSQQQPSSNQQSVLVTGCSEGGIGFALAREFQRRGLRVFATVRGPSKAQHLRNLAGMEVIQLDVTSSGSIRAAAETVASLTAADGACLDLLVNNAGNGYQVPLLDADLDEARRLFEVNVWGVLAVTQAFAPLLVKAAARGGRPRVVNIGSVVSRVPVPWGGIYNASKGALAVLNDNLRLELQPLGIEVLHIVTGGISTKFYGNSAGQSLPADSVYAPVAQDIDEAVAGHTASTMQTMTPETYARKVVSNILSKRPTTTMWIGGNAFLSWLGIKFGWDSIRDFIIGYMFSMGSLARKYRQATQRKQA